MAVAALILVVGFLAKPEKPSQPVPSGPELARLQSLAQRKRLSEIGDYLSGVGTTVSNRLVYVFELDASGLLWHDGRIVTGHIPNGGPITYSVGQMQAAGARASRCLVPAGAGFGCLQPRRGAFPSFSRNARDGDISPGEWVLAVAADGPARTRSAQGLFESSAKVTCSGRVFDEIRSTAVIGTRFVGGGLFDLDGQLLGPIIQCGERFVVVSADSFASVYSTPVPTIDRIEQFWGFRVLPANPQKPAASAKVAVVWAGSAASSAGIQPGDSIISIEGRKSESENDLGDVLLGSPIPAQVELRIERGRNVLALTLQRGVQPDVNASSPLGFEIGLRSSAPQGAPVNDVRPGTPAAQIGLRPGDRITAPDPAAVLTPKSAAPVRIEFSRNGQLAKAVLNP